MNLQGALDIIVVEGGSGAGAGTGGGGGGDGCEDGTEAFEEEKPFEYQSSFRKHAGRGKRGEGARTAS